MHAYVHVYVVGVSVPRLSMGLAWVVSHPGATLGIFQGLLSLVPGRPVPGSLMQTSEDVLQCSWGLTVPSS